MPATISIDTDQRGVLTACPQCGQRSRMSYELLGKTFRCGACHTELPPPGEPIEIRNETIFRSLTTRSALPVLVDVWAPWCGPCKMVAPELDKVAAEGAGKWLVIKLNSEELSGLTGELKISAIPTLILFKNGREFARNAGAMRAPEIRRFIEQ